MKDFQKYVFDTSIVFYKGKTIPLVKAGVVLDKEEDGLYLKVGLSITQIGNTKTGLYLAWCSSVSSSPIHNKTLVLYKKDWTPTIRKTMENILSSVLDGVGDTTNQFTVDNENIIMHFRQLTSIERSFFS